MVFHQLFFWSFIIPIMSHALVPRQYCWINIGLATRSALYGYIAQHMHSAVGCHTGWTSVQPCILLPIQPEKCWFILGGVVDKIVLNHFKRWWSDRSVQTDRVIIMGKAKHKIINWSEYNKSLRNRGSLTFGMDDAAIKGWLCHQHHGGRGRGFQLVDCHCSTRNNPL